MEKYNTEYKDYTNSVAVMISTDRLLFMEKSQVRARMLEYMKLYKELHIIVFSSKKMDPIVISSGCKIYSTNSSLRINYVSDACKLGKKIVKGVSKDIPILVTCQDPFETALAGKYIANLRKESELLIQIHTDLLSPYFIDKRIGIVNSCLNRVRLYISKFTLPHAQVIRVVSIKIANSLVSSGMSREKIVVKPIDINIGYINNPTPPFNLKSKFPKFSKIILLVARLEPEKNVSMAIDAMKIVNKSRSDIGLIIVGSGSEMVKLKKQAYNLNLSQTVVFEGWQTDLTPYYRGADLLLVTSWYEGYGMVFKEAQSVGLKIVSTDVGIAREMGVNIVEWNQDSFAKGILNTI